MEKYSLVLLRWPINVVFHQKSPIIGVLGADSHAEARLHTCIDCFLLPLGQSHLIGYLTARQEALSMV